MSETLVPGEPSAGDRGGAVIFCGPAEERAVLQAFVDGARREPKPVETCSPPPAPTLFVVRGLSGVYRGVRLRVTLEEYVRELLT